MLDREFGRIRDVQIVDLHGQGFGLQTLAITGRAGGGGLEFRDLVARPLTVGLAVAAIEIGDDALKGFLHLIAAQTIIIDELDFLIAGAVEDHVAHGLFELVPGGVEVEIVMVGKRLQRLSLIGRGSACPGSDGALGKGEILVRYDEFRVHF